MYKILIIEDNEMNRDMLARRLTKSGYEIVTAADGQEGIDKAHTEHPSLILMDMGLPIVDGWEATRRLKEDAETNSIPIIALTAHAMQSDLESTLEAGCDDYDSKPVDYVRLSKKIEHFLPKAGG